MADNKRNSVAGKVATPKNLPSGPTHSPVDTLEALGKALGARIKLTTSAPHSQDYEGTLHTACPILNVVAINTRGPLAVMSPTAALQPGDYHIIPVSRIQSFLLTAVPNTSRHGDGGFAHSQPAIGLVDTKRLKQREEERIRKLKEDQLDKGKGVTKEAQAIFDSFRRINTPIRWHNQEMIVHEAVVITPPYRTEDCKCATGRHETLNRVKKVLEGERQKIKEKEERERERERKATATGPRKGG